MLGQPATPDDETGPRLLSGPTGEVFSLWQRSGDLRTGGGGVFLALASPQHAWQKVLEILPNETGITALDPDVAFGSSGAVALAYQWRRHDPRTKQIRLARSDGGGKTWTQSSTSIDGSGAGFTPKLGWGRGRSLVVVWADERRFQRTWDIYARRSPDGGATWEPEQLLSRFPQQTSADLYARPEMVSDGLDHFWVVWVGLRNGRSSLYLSRSADGGQTWADPVALSGQSTSVFGQRLFRSGGRLLLVWQDTRTGRDRIYAVASANGGVTWSSPTRVDHLPADSQTDASSPAAVLGPDGEALVVWQDGRNGRDDIFAGRSGDGGRTWGTEDMRLDMDDAGTAVSRVPRIASAADGRLAVAWEDDRAGYEGIYLRVRAAGKSPAWGPEMLVAPPGQKKAARIPTVLWGRGGALYVAWEVWDYARGPLAVTKQVDGRTLLLDKK
ncbi:MAG TPA: sialidase family protein [Methylomirabilota bacterium]|nr:sialidase family protein [Methylomirabilota bacterium]